jgi:hypothetical protein
VSHWDGESARDAPNPVSLVREAIERAVTVAVVPRQTH